MTIVVVRPAMVSSIIALVVEVPLCLFLSLWGIKGFAYYLSFSTSVAQIAQTMWKASSFHNIQSIRPC